MCGVAGIFDGQIASEGYPAVLDRMAASIIHRGPDEGGALALPQLRAGLASRRLSIVVPYARDARSRLLVSTLAARDRTEIDIEWLCCMSPTISSALINSRILSATPDLQLLLPHPTTTDSYRTYLDRLLSLEQHGRLTDGILLENDKMSMAHSLESRMPFLD